MGPIEERNDAQLIAAFWEDVGRTAARQWRLLGVFGTLLMALGLPADLRNLAPEHFTAGLWVRFLGVGYFLVTALWAAAAPRSFGRWYRWVWAGTVPAVSTVCAVLGAWDKHPDDLYFLGVLESEFGVVAFLTLPVAWQLAGMIAGNLLFLTIYPMLAPPGEALADIWITFVIFGLIAAVAYQRLHSYRLASWIRQQHLARSKERIERILSSIRDGFLVLDDQWRFSYINSEGSQYLQRMQRSIRELIGKCIWEEWPGLEDSELKRELLRCRREGVPVRFEEYYPLMDAHMEVHAYPTEEGVSVFFHDISERKAAEEELRRSRDMLERMVAERTAEIRRLLANMERLQEEERKRISREVHDELGQLLAVLRFELAALRQRAQRLGDDPELADRFAYADELVQMTIATVRQIARRLRSGILEDLGLPAALEWLAHRFRQGDRLEVSVHVDPEELVVDDATKVVLYRVAQEALTNVVRHARAQRVEIWIETTPTTIRMRIRDDGRGFVVPRTQSFGRGLGLVGMRERVHQRGGLLRIFSRPGEGTLIEAEVPRSPSDEGEWEESA